ncbi:hypothetical protein ABGT15_10565 [Flavobacterium enshiense]|uniref:hypothetical protein n=1 Tax=Flavobacterium enshiense TaxID=1341165 RepID=UPI00345C90A8
MKKKLEAELISIAHRILKLKGKEDVVLLHQEAQKLYEKLSILRFYEENFEALKPTLTHEELEDKIEIAYEEKAVVVEEPKAKEEVAEEIVQEEVTTPELTTEELPVEEEKILVGQVEIDESELDEEEPVVAVEEPQEEIIEPLFEPVVAQTEEEETVAEKKNEPQQISFEDLLGDSYKEPEFVKVDDVPAEVEKAADIVFEKAEEPVAEASNAEIIAETPKEEKPLEAIKAEITKEKEDYKATSLNLNDKFSKTITLGLNDRITFEKYLFDGSGEDLNRVISQLNTFNTMDEAKSFIEDLVKPDYNNWKGKDEFAERFMELVEKKFA